MHDTPLFRIGWFDVLPFFGGWVTGGVGVGVVWARFLGVRVASSPPPFGSLLFRILFFLWGWGAGFQV